MMHAVIAMFVILGIVAIVTISQHVKAVAPTITGGSTITGYTDNYIPITDLSVQGTVTGTTPVTISAPGGTFRITNSSGVTFNGPTTGAAISFTGTQANVNNALASLQYRANDPGTVTITASTGTPGMVYYPGNGHTYEIVTPESPLSWDDAYTAALGRSMGGAQGYLATITTQPENDYITARMQGDGWFGASDSQAEGVWKWVDGPEAGTQFWQGLGNGNTVGGNFANWAGGEPNDSGADEDCAQFYGNGSGWNDLPCGNSATLSSYVVEYGSPSALPAEPTEITFSAVTTRPAPQTVTINACADFMNEYADSNQHRYDTINLTQNLDCTGYSFYSLFSEIDSNTSQRLGFEGTFNGNGHTISHLTITPRLDQYGNPMSSGFLGFALGATIEDVTFNDLTVTGQSCLGGVVGTADNITMHNVSMHGTVSPVDTNSGDSIGGIIGCLYDSIGNSSVTNNSFSGTVNAPNGNKVGGIIGEATANNGHILTLDNNTNTGTLHGGGEVGGLIGDLDISSSGSNISIVNGHSTGLTSNGSYIGGIIGYLSASSNASILIDSPVVMSTVEGNDSVGGIIGYIEAYIDGTTIHLTNAHLSIPVSGEYSVGGLVGYAEIVNVSDVIFTIDHSSTTGDVSAYGDVGGLVGALYGSNDEGFQGYPSVYVYRSYATGDITMTSNVYGGGLFGELGNTKVEESYATGNVTAPSGGYAGGLAGFTDYSTILNSYARGNVNANSTVAGLAASVGQYTELTNSYSTGDVQSSGTIGGLISEDVSGTTTDTATYWDTDTSHVMSSLFGTGKTTAQMKQRSTFSAWDFGGVWGINSSLNNGYPCLQWTDNNCVANADEDGISDAIEQAAPNNGDANNDGTSDATQSNVTSFINPITSKYVVLEVDPACSVTNASIGTESSNGTLDAGYTYHTGLMDFAVSCGTPGFTTTVKQYYYGLNSSSNLIVRKYNPTTHTYTTVTGHSLALSSRTIGGQSAVVVSYTVSDGDNLDTDGLVNGVIVDPIGLATQDTVGTPNTGEKTQSILLFVVSGVTGVVLLVATAIYVVRDIKRRG